MSPSEHSGYSMIRDIAGGGMSHLFVVRDANDERAVIRKLKEEYVRDRRIRKNFLHSAKILSQLHHPNIIRVLDCGKDGREPFMIMEYVEGRNMRELILHRDPMLTENAFSFLRQMAAVLYYVHMQGYLHLDFKPENLLVRDSGELVLIDFDLVMERKSKPVRIREVPGTPAYVAPEILTKRLVDERADIYSFGVTAYEMLCYHKPFEARTVEEARSAQIDPSIPPALISQYSPTVPPQLQSIVLKCLAKDWDARYPSMSLVIKDLKSIL